MKILFLSALYPPDTKGGGELSTHYIARGLIERGHQVQVVCSGPARAQAVYEGVPVLRLPIPLTAKPLLEKRLTRRMAKQLANEITNPDSYDIIHSHDFRTALLLAELGWPHSVVTARDYAQICGSPDNMLSDGSACPGCNWYTVWRNEGIDEAAWWRKPFRAWQYVHNIGFRKQSFQRLPHQVFISRAQQAMITQHQPRPVGQSAVIYNPVPATYLSELPKASHGGNVLFVGTIKKHKGVGLLLAAWRRIVEDKISAHLTIVGDGARRAEYEHVVDHWGLRYYVTFTGYITPERIMSVYDEAAVVVSPHLWIEPFGRVIVEAMARGKIVVAANTGGPAEIVQDNETGFLFARNSVDDLYRRLIQAMVLPELPQRAMQARARAWVAQHLTVSGISRQYEEFYLTITTKQR